MVAMESKSYFRVGLTGERIGGVYFWGVFQDLGREGE